MDGFSLHEKKITVEGFKQKMSLVWIGLLTMALLVMVVLYLQTTVVPAKRLSTPTISRVLGDHAVVPNAAFLRYTPEWSSPMSQIDCTYLVNSFHPTKNSPLGDKVELVATRKEALAACVANRYQRVLILEEGFQMELTPGTLLQILHRLFSLNLRWDVIVLDGVADKTSGTSFDFLNSVQGVSNLFGFLINAKAAAQFDEETPYWYMINPSTRNKTTAVTTPLQYLMMVKTCVPRWLKNETSPTYEQKLAFCAKYPVQFYYYHADPKLPTDYLLDEHRHLLIVKTMDDYLNLCHKVISMFQFVHHYLSTNGRTYGLKGLFCMDDDVRLVDGDLLYEELEKRARVPYWGNVVHQARTSKHWMEKATECAHIRRTVQRYPALSEYPVETPQGHFCSGGAFFLQPRSMELILLHNDLFRPFPSTNKEILTYRRNGVLRKLCAFDDVNIAAALRRENIKPQPVNIFPFVSWK